MRCFVAIDPPAEVRTAIARVQAAVRAAAGGADVRWVDLAAVHLTLKFLGEVAETRVPGVAEALRVVAAGTPPLALAVGGVGAFPAPHRARVVWIGITGGATDLARLAAAIDRGLAGLGFVPEVRPFSSHLTVGRVRSSRGRGRLAAAIENAPRDEIGSWTARQVVLYRSHLRPGGAVYEAVARLPLAGADA